MFLSTFLLSCKNTLHIKELVLVILHDKNVFLHFINGLLTAYTVFWGAYNSFILFLEKPSQFKRKNKLFIQIFMALLLYFLFSSTALSV